MIDAEGKQDGHLRLEQALLESEERFRLLVSCVQDYAIFMLDLDGRVSSWNTGAQRIKGYAPAEIINRHFSIFYTPEDIALGVPERELETTRNTGRYEAEGWRVRKDGSHFHAHVVITPLLDNSGRLRGYAKVTRDVSAHKQFEERFRRVVESAPNAMVMINRAGTIEMVNTQAEHLFGYARSEMLGAPVEMLVPERFRAHHPGLRGSFFHAPQSRPMGAGRDLFGLRKDGSEIPIEIGLNPIETEQGTMVLSAIVDISTRKRLEERFRRVVESAPNAMVMTNRAGAIEMVNTQAELMFGYARTEMLGAPVEMLVPERFRAHHPGLRGSFFHAPQSRPMGAGRDLFGRRKDGSEIPIEIGLNPIETDEGPMVLSAIVDISDRKQKEEHVRAALQEKELLLGEIHHRVKNNLQIVDSLLDMQALRIDDPQVNAILRDSQNRIRSMALIHQTLYQSHDFARVDFASIVDSLVPTLVSSYGINAQRISVEISADAVHLPINFAIPCGLIINELVTNALKHAFPDERAGVISLQLHPFGDNGVELVVGDDGVGIPEHLNLEQSDTLGLQLMQLLASQVNGALTIQRKPTQFILTFALPTSHSAE